MKKKIINLLLSFVLMTALIPTVTAAGSDIDVIVNGDYVSFDQPPIIIEGRALVPLRAIFEALGASVYWRGDTRTVIAYDVVSNVEVIINIDSDIIYVNSEPVVIDVPAFIEGDRTLIPLRAVAEAFSNDVEWDDEENTIRITSDDYSGIAGTWILSVDDAPSWYTKAKFDTTCYFITQEDGSFELGDDDHGIIGDGIWTYDGNIITFSLNDRSPDITGYFEGNYLLLEVLPGNDMIPFIRKR